MAYGEATQVSAPSSGGPASTPTCFMLRISFSSRYALLSSASRCQSLHDACIQDTHLVNLLVCGGCCTLRQAIAVKVNSSAGRGHKLFLQMVYANGRGQTSAQKIGLSMEQQVSLLQEHTGWSQHQMKGVICPQGCPQGCQRKWHA